MEGEATDAATESNKSQRRISQLLVKLHVAPSVLEILIDLRSMTQGYWNGQAKTLRVTATAHTYSFYAACS